MKLNITNFETIYNLLLKNHPNHRDDFVIDMVIKYFIVAEGIAKVAGVRNFDAGDLAYSVISAAFKSRASSQQFTARYADGNKHMWKNENGYHRIGEPAIIICDGQTITKKMWLQDDEFYRCNQLPHVVEYIDESSDIPTRESWYAGGIERHRLRILDTLDEWDEIVLNRNTCMSYTNNVKDDARAYKQRLLMCNEIAEDDITFGLGM